MKKVLSVLLAITMLCALCIPAFADSTITEKSNPQSGQTLVKVDISKVAADGEWEVKYPAEVNIEWGAVSTVIPDYEIKTHLVVGKNLKVTVAKADDKLTYLGEELAYALSGATVVTLGEVEAMTPAVSIDILAANWNNAPIAEYTGNLTFSAEVVPA